MSKYCPLSKWQITDQENPYLLAPQKCLMDKCGWWLEGDKICAVLGIACMLEIPVNIRRVE